MPFDPAKPAANSPNSSAEMRAQLNALKALSDALQSQVDALSALVAAQAAQIAGLQTEMEGRPTLVEMNDAISGACSATLGSALAGSSNNTNAVDLINQTPLDPPTSNDVAIAYSKINEFLNTARRT